MMLRAALGFFTRLPIGSAPLPPTFRGVAVWLPGYRRHRRLVSMTRAGVR